MTSVSLKSLAHAVWMATRGILRMIYRLSPRLYAAAMIFLICWLTYLALRYLVVSLTRPQPVPPQISALPVRLDRGVMQTGRSAFQALEATEHPRSPLAHYHRLDSWIQPDAFNDCTRSGCHNPLPHSKRKEVRAFLNMHATSIHCGVCHIKSDETPRPLVWYDVSGGGSRGPPSILDLYGLLADGGPKSWARPTAADQKRIVRLLRDGAKEAGGLAVLRHLADHFAAVRPSSETFQWLLAEARDALPRHFRGEYGAKLALRDPRDGRPILGHAETKQAVEAFFSAKDAAGPEEKKRLLDAVHPLRSDRPLNCTDCHRREGSLIDFARMGYPQARIDALTAPIVFRMIEHINAGRPFNLPAVMSPAQPPPASGSPSN